MRVLKFIVNSGRPYYLYLWGLFFAICLVTIDNTLKPFLVKQLIDTVAGDMDHSLWTIFILYAILQFILVAAWTLSDYSWVRYTSRFRLDITNYFMQRLYLFTYTFFQNQLAGNLTSKIADTFQLVPVLVFTIIHHFCYFILLIIISIILLASVAPIFAIIMLAWVTLFFTITFLAMKKNMILNKDYAEEKSKIIGLVADYLSNMLSVKTFANKHYELLRFNGLKKEFLTAAEKQGFYFMRFYMIQGLFTSIYALGFIIYLIMGYQKSQVSPGDFALVIMINFNIINTNFQLSGILREFVANWGSVDQALSLIEDVPDIQDKTHAKELQIEKGKIVFNSVQFHYKNTESLFQNKSVSIEAGQKVGLVGYSGGGKSTFVNLILRLYDVNDGQIMIDNQDICDVTQDSLRQAIAMIPQDPLLFHRTLMENIRYGCIDATDSEVVEAAKLAYADEFIKCLPQGYNSLVGERGVKLSGGQRQRIAIARAILKNAPILILDEATSQLDSVTEGVIQKSLWTLMQDKTTIVIAHRLSTLLNMDRILVFDQGKIVEDGTHGELINKRGLYKILWDAQVGGFLPDQQIEHI